jgi:hypothetical protein
LINALVITANFAAGPARLVIAKAAGAARAQLGKADLGMALAAQGVGTAVAGHVVRPVIGVADDENLHATAEQHHGGSGHRQAS